MPWPTPDVPPTNMATGGWSFGCSKVALEARTASIEGISRGFGVREGGDESRKELAEIPKMIKGIFKSSEFVRSENNVVPHERFEILPTPSKLP